MALVPRTMPVGGHIFVTAHMRVAVPPNFPIKEAVLAKLVSLWLPSRPHCEVPSCDFSLAMPYASPPPDNLLLHSLSSLISIMCVFSTVCIGAMPYHCTT